MDAILLIIGILYQLPKAFAMTILIPLVAIFGNM